MKYYKKLNYYGDTIVEVLIALTILSFAMSVSYATANSSIRGLYIARTTSRATALMQKQIEYIRVKTPTSNNFCYDSSGNFISFTPGNINDACRNQDGIFTVSINRTGAGPYEYNLSATWSAGENQYTSTMKYVY